MGIFTKNTKIILVDDLAFSKSLGLIQALHHGVNKLIPLMLVLHSQQEVTNDHQVLQSVDAEGPAAVR